MIIDSKLSLETQRFEDVPVTVEARIGSRPITLREVLGLKPRSILSLGRPAGETVDLIVGNVRLGSAEVVVVDDRLALRVTDFDPRLLVPSPTSGT